MDFFSFGERYCFETRIWTSISRFVSDFRLFWEFYPFFWAAFRDFGEFPGSFGADFPRIMGFLFGITIRNRPIPQFRLYGVVFWVRFSNHLVFRFEIFGILAGLWGFIWKILGILGCLGGKILVKSPNFFTLKIPIFSHFSNFTP